MKPKKPNFNSSELPSPKGISAVPAKMRDASPNFVNENKIEEFRTKAGGYSQRKVEDAGTNPNNPSVPNIGYQELRGGRAWIKSLTNKGDFKYSTEGGKCSPKGCSIPTPIDGGKKSTSSMPVKNEQFNTIMDKNNKNLKIGNAKKTEKYIK